MIKPGLKNALIVALLGLVAVCGVVPASASAAGTTSFTCKSTSGGGSGFSDSHCVNAVSVGATFIHEALPLNTSTPITIATTAATKIQIMGPVVVLECSSGSGTGTVKNEEVGGEMVASGTAEVTFTGCALVTAPPGCTIASSTLVAKPWRFTTKGQAMGVNFEPQLGTILAEAKVSGCTGAGSVLNGAWPLEGHVVLIPNGTTLASTDLGTTSPVTLTFFGGHTAGLVSSFTVTGTSTGSGISLTT